MTNLLKNKEVLIDRILNSTGIDIRLTENCDNYFTKEFERIFEKIDYLLYKDRLLYFSYFLSQLEKIKAHNQKNFNNYLSKFSLDGVNLRGEKFEILTYARLIDKAIYFSKPKHNPDFQFEINNDFVFIECGSRQTDKKGYFTESIEQAITNKQVKGNEQNYANKNTALHIEISKCVFNSYGGEDFLADETLYNILEKTIHLVDFGAVVLINNFYAQEDEIVYGHPFIKYKNNCNNNLRDLHKKMFDLQNIRVTRILKEHL